MQQVFGTFALIVLFDAFCAALWALSHQEPEGWLYFGSITNHVISFVSWLV